VRGLFVNGAIKKNQGRTDFGYFVDKGSYSSSVSELEDKVAEDEAYMVEVFETENCYHIRLRSENRHIAAETKGKIEKKGKGIRESVHQTTEEPLMPGECEDPHRAIEAYAEYAIEHQDQVEGIEADFDVEDVFDDENQEF
jgi:hypothetical protein